MIILTKAFLSLFMHIKLTKHFIMKKMERAGLYDCHIGDLGVYC